MPALFIHEWRSVHTVRLVFVCITTKTRTTREPRISPQLAVNLECFRNECGRRWGHESRSRDHLFASPFGPAEHISRAAAELALRQMISCNRPQFYAKMFQNAEVRIRWLSQFLSNYITGSGCTWPFPSVQLSCGPEISAADQRGQAQLLSQVVYDSRCDTSSCCMSPAVSRMSSCGLRFASEIIRFA